MYTVMDEEIFLAPESIISGVLANEPAEDPIAGLDVEELAFDSSFEANDLD